MFIGAIFVDIAMEQYNLHSRLALKVAILAGAKSPAEVATTFALFAFVMSSISSNVAVSLMLVPFATGILDTAREQCKSKEQVCMHSHCMQTCMHSHCMHSLH